MVASHKPPSPNTDQGKTVDIFDFCIVKDLEYDLSRKRCQMRHEWTCVDRLSKDGEKTARNFQRGQKTQRLEQLINCMGSLHRSETIMIRK